MIAEKLGPKSDLDELMGFQDLKEEKTPKKRAPRIASKEVRQSDDDIKIGDSYSERGARSTGRKR